MSIPKNSEFVSHIREMIRFSWLIVPLALVAGGLVYIWSNSQDRTFTAEASLRLIVDFENSSSEDVTDFRTRSYGELALTPAVLQRAITTGGLAATVTVASDRTSVQLRDTPGFLDITATGPTGAEAAALANAVANALVESVAAEILADETTRLEIVAPAAAPNNPAGRSPWTDATLATIIAAILLGESFVLLRRSSGRLSPVSAGFEAGQIFGAPVFSGGDDPADLRSFVDQHMSHHPVVAVVQTAPADAGTVAIAVAFASLRDEHHAVVIDADTGQPRLHGAANVALNPGVGEVIDGRVAFKDAVRVNLSANRVWILPAGSASVDATSGRERLSQVRAMIQQTTIDRIILSITQSSNGHESAIVAGVRPQAVVVAIDPNHARAKDLRRLRNQMDATGVPIVGVLLTRRSGDESQRGLLRFGRPSALSA